MNAALLVTVAAGLAALATPGSAHAVPSHQPLPTLLVMAPLVDGGASPAAAEALTHELVACLRSLDRAQIITAEQLQEGLAHHVRDLKLGCDGRDCAGGTTEMAADQVLRVRLGVVESALVLNVSRAEVRSGRVLGSAHRRVGVHQLDRLFAALPQVAARIMGAPLPRGGPAPTSRTALRASVKHLPAAVLPRIAVMPFAVRTNDPAGTSEPEKLLEHGVADIVATDLAATGMVVGVERNRLLDALEALNLSSGAAGWNALDVQRAAQTLGVTYLVLGTVWLLAGDTFQVHVRVVHAATGRVAMVLAMVGPPPAFMAQERAMLTAMLEGLGVPPPDHVRGALLRQAHGSLEDALAYSQALAAVDQGNRVAALAHTQALLKRSPDFEPAVRMEQRLAPH